MQNKIDWLKSSVIYQIYPQSFCDMNDDGIGDLDGIIQKLDYISWLGCNVIWLNPCYDSPFEDAGYDVSDYLQIAARYGTNGTMKKLIDSAHEKGLKIILDFVPGHTSINHPWFVQSQQHDGSKFDLRYIWAERKYDITNETEKFIHDLTNENWSYAANFFPFQPALNYGYANPDSAKPWQLPTDHPAVAELISDMIDIVRFWLEMGADGLRADMASSLVKQDSECHETKKIWSQIRKIIDQEYPQAILLSEWSDPIRAIDGGFHVDFLIHVNSNAYTSLFRNENGRNVFLSDVTKYSFFDRRGLGNIKEFLDVYLEQYEKTKSRGFICIPSGNHDIPRLCFNRSHDELKVIFSFLLTMPGIPAIYYGDEIGIPHYSGLKSKEGAQLFESETGNRTGARTPMQWNSSENSGFSTANKENLYLPICPQYKENNVELQSSQPDSLLSHVRNLLELRDKHNALKADAEFEVIFGEKDRYPFIYSRRSNDEKILILLNPQNASVNLDLINHFSDLDHEIYFESLLKSDSKVFSVHDGKHIHYEAGPISYGIFQVKNRN